MTVGLRYFPPFRLDLKNEQLWRGRQEIRLRRKTFAVLRYLVEHPRELVTKAALLDAIWPDVSVSDSMPAISVRELRKALGDSADTPRFIETVQGRGYRFIAAVSDESVEAPVPIAPVLLSSQLRAARNTYVGREAERAELRAVMADAISGRPRICLVIGELGIGKTRLCAEFATEAQAKGMNLFIGHCSEQEGLPYLPFVEMLENFIDRVPSPTDLRRALGEDGAELGRMLPKLKRILPDLPLPMELSPEQARWHLFNCFCKFIARQSREQPTVMILEDLHWADDSTLDLFAHLSQRLSDLALLVICTYRASEVAGRPNLSRTLEDLVRGRLAARIKLDGLPPDEVAQMVQCLSGQSPPPNVVRKIYGETDGNPFFVEELFRYLAEENRLFDRAGQFRVELEIGDTDVPDNVLLVVGRRLARLSEATNKTLAIAAVIGRSFAFELLEASAIAAPETLLDNLDEAESVQLIRSTSEHGEPCSEFSHELVRQVVLSQLSAARAARLHLDVAEAIERIYSATLEDHYGGLAHHYTHTGNTWKAVKYLHLASKQDAERGSYTEAVAHFEAGLELLKKLPDDDQCAKMELDLRIGAQPALGAIKGQGSVEALHSAERALVLSQRPGVEWQKNWGALSGIFSVQLFRNIPRLCELAAQLVALAEANGSADHQADALFCLAWAKVETANFRGAAETLDKEKALLDSMPPLPTNRAHLVRIADNVGLRSFTLWCLGYPDLAVERILAATSIAEASGSKASLRIRYSGAGFLYLFRGDLDRLRSSAEANLALTTELGDLTHIGQSEILLGWAQSMTGDLAGGIARMRRHASEYRAAGAEWAAEYFLTLIAVVLSRTGQLDEALLLIGEALAIIDKIGERLFEAEVNRVKGELLLAQNSSNTASAENCFRTAIEISRKQHAKSWELRATMSLARLLAKQGRCDEARAMLAEIHGWFTEGFDTADLKDAKALLDELA